MPRPQRCRKVCFEPEYEKFSPSGIVSGDNVNLSVDEFEVIRLVDLEKKTHEQTAKQMNISRTTVTEVYESAREKIADSIINGKHLIISGGNYELCSGNKEHCGKKCRHRKSHIREKGSNIMRIAVTYENGEIFQHFGHTENFKIYDVEDGKVKASSVISSEGSGHGALAGLLKELSVDVLICGGIGGGAQMALMQAGIKLFGGVKGDADKAVEAFLEDSLSYDPDAKCDHHGHDHEHNCGDHGCSNHDCGSHGCH